MRIASQQMYSVGLRNMLSQQAEVLKTQQQVSSGKKFEYAAEDPVGALSSATLQRSIDRIDQYDKNIGLVQTRLSLEETAVTGSVNILQRVRELVLVSNNATQNDESRQSTAKEIREQVKALMQLANSQDGSGRYLFGGYNNDAVPYAVNGTGTVATTPRTVSVPSSAITDFTAIAAGEFSINGVGIEVPANGTTAADRANDLLTAINAKTAETGVSASVSGGNLTLTSADSFTVMSENPAKTGISSYDPHWVRQVEISPGRTIGDSDSLLGLFEQAPVNPADPSAGVLNAFKVLEDIALELETPEATTPRPTGPLKLSDRLTQAIKDLDSVLGHFIDTRSSIGVRQLSLDNQLEMNADTKLQLVSLKSDNEDVDLAESYSRLSLQLTGLEAAQKAFVQVQGLSLFKYL